MHLIEHLLSLIELVQSESCLRTSQIVIRLQHIAHIRMNGVLFYFFLSKIAVEECFPLHCQLLEFFVFLHLVQLVAQIGIQVGNGRGFIVNSKQQVDTLAIGRHTLLMIVHV